MLRLNVSLLMVSLAACPCLAETIEGKLVSISVEERTLTLETGEALALSVSVSMDGLETGQIIRADCEEGSAKALSVDIIEARPPYAGEPEPIEEVAPL